MKQLMLLLMLLRLVRSFRTMPPHNTRVPSPLCLAASAASSPSSVEGGSPSASVDGGGGDDKTVTILQRSANHIVALKPYAVVCHHSGWAGSRSAAKRGEEPEIPMLQRVRDAIHDIDTRAAAANGGGGEPIPMRKVNLVHRLDRGASGALLLTFADEETGGSDADSVDSGGSSGNKKGDTAQLIGAMQSPDSVKTYVALVRGEGMLHGEDLKKKGWFEVSRPIKDDSGELKDATTLFNFVAGQAETSFDRPRISLVLARPKQGRWHQIRRHLNGLSHPILGDSCHGVSKVREKYIVFVITSNAADNWKGC